MAHGITVEQKRCMVRSLPPGPVQLGQAQPGDASGHDEQGGDDLAQWLERRCRDMGAEAWEKGYKVPPGLLRRLVSVAVVVDDTSTTVLRQKPFLMSAFGEGLVRCHISLYEKLSVTAVDQVLTRLRSRAGTACGPPERRSGTIQERPVWH